MQAILLATGENKKLKPLTNTVPAPMVSLAGRPVMSYAMELLIRQGLKRIVVSMYSLAGDIEAYFGTGSRWGLELDYVLQPDAWGSAGSLCWAKHRLTDTFIVMPADRFVEVDLLPIMEQHKQQNSTATVVVHQGRNFKPGLQNKGMATSPAESSALAEECSETGIYIFDTCVLDLIPPRTYFDISRDLIPAILSAGNKVDQIVVRGLYSSLDTFKAFHDTQSALLCKAFQEQACETSDLLNRNPLILGRSLMEGVWIGRNSNVHPDARIEPPVVIGSNSYVARGAEIGPETVIGNNVVIDEEATVVESTILDGTYVGRFLNIEHRLVRKGLVIDIPTGQTTSITDGHLLSETFKAIDDSALAGFIDRAIALIFLLLSLPFTLLFALLTFLTSGRVFQHFAFSHRYPVAVGVQEIGEARTIHLMRYNTVNAEGQLTWFGKLLERFDLHRLPEFWNVLKGDIRIVGVKPLSAEEVSQISETWQEKRFEMPPGITGLWYVQAAPESDFNEIIVNDVYYAATRSWSVDMNLIFKTVITWFRRL